MKVGGYAFLCVAFLMFGLQSTAGQSGRRTTLVTPSPSPTPQATTPVKPTPDLEDDDIPLTKPADAPKISSILVAGEIVHDYKFYKSNDLDTALKECVSRLRAITSAKNAEKIGTLRYNEAKTRAKDGDDYVLWIAYVSKDDGYGNMRIDYADYAILMPRTGRRLTFGQVRPGARSVVGTGGILGLPTSKTRSSPVAVRNEMKEIARQIPEILVHGGWMKH